MSYKYIYQYYYYLSLFFIPFPQTQLPTIYKKSNQICGRRQSCTRRLKSSGSSCAHSAETTVSSKLYGTGGQRRRHGCGFGFKKQFSFLNFMRLQFAFLCYIYIYIYIYIYGRRPLGQWGECVRDSLLISPNMTVSTHLHKGKTISMANGSKG